MKRPVLKSRKGYAVAIRRKDGSEFLASTNGILPFVHVKRRWAVQHKRELIKEGFDRCRVVPVVFADVVCETLGNSASAADWIMQTIAKGRASRPWTVNDLAQESQRGQTRSNIKKALHGLVRRGLLECRRMDGAEKLYLLK